MTEQTRGGDKPAFEPQLSAASTPAPFSPTAYFYVGFFVGFLALAYVAIQNLNRFPRIQSLRERTFALLAATGIGLLVALLVLPIDVLEGSPRIPPRIAAVLASIALYRFHRGPALGGANRYGGEYTSAWKAIGPIIALSLLQGIVTYVLIRSRGAL